MKSKDMAFLAMMIVITPVLQYQAREWLAAIWFVAFIGAWIIEK